MNTYSLKKFFISPFPVKILPYLLIIFSALGFLDMTYLAIGHYQNIAPPCTIHGCDVVLTSKFADILGIPLSLFGAFYFLGFIVLGGLYITLSTKPYSLRLLIFVLSVISLIVSIVLVGLQAFVLHAFCQYCLFAELMFFLVFDTAWWLYNGLRDR